MTSRLRKILKGDKITPKTADEIAVKTAIDNAGSGGGSTITVDDTITENGTNPVKGGAIYTALTNKQGTLTFDDAPMENSTNPVKSGGVYNAIAAVNNDYVVTFTASGQTLIADKQVADICAARLSGKNVYGVFALVEGAYQQYFAVSSAMSGDGMYQVVFYAVQADEDGGIFSVKPVCIVGSYTGGASDSWEVVDT